MTDALGNVAFIGIGKMGLPMSDLVAKAGFAVTAFDQSAVRINEARAQGIAVAASPAEAVRGKAAVVTSLPDDAALRGGLLGPTGLIAAMTPGTTLIRNSQGQE